MAKQDLLRDGSILQDRFKVIRQIGRGGMGAVYEALNTNLNQTIVLKQTFYDDRDPRLIQAFNREARLLAKLKHESLPKVTDYFSENGSYYIVMDYIPGEDLSARLKREGRFTLKEVIKIADHILEVLTYLHEQIPPIYHRDIKPANIKLLPNGKVTLLDFGIAKGSLTETSDPKSSIGYGTPGYAPPEIEEPEENEQTDQRSDLYSLSATLYCLLSGSAPVRATKRRIDILSGKPDPLLALHNISAEVNQPVSEIIHKGLSIDASHRQTNAREMRKALLLCAPVDIDWGNTISGDHHELGDIHFQRKEYKKSILAYTLALHENSDDASAYEKRGDAYYCLRDFNRAIADYTDALRRAPNNPILNLKCGDAYFENNIYNEAAEKYYRAIELDPYLREAYCGLGDAYLESDYIDNAISCYSSAIKLDPNQSDTYNNRGIAYNQKKDYQSAVEDYSMAIKLNGDIVDYYVNRGDAYLKVGKYRNAISDYSSAINLGENNDAIFRNRANAYMMVLNYENAISDFSQALAHNPQDYRCYYYRGSAYREVGNYKKAISDFSLTIRLNPRMPEPYYDRGDLYYEDGALGKAIADYRQAMRLNPNYADSYWETSWDHLSQKEYRAWFSQLIKFLILKTTSKRSGAK